MDDLAARSGERPVDGRMGPSLRSAVPPFHVMEVMRAAEARERAGHRVLHLEVGQPSTAAPAAVLAAAHAALDSDRLGYTGAAGTLELRRRIARWYEQRHDLTVDPERVVITTGASGGCMLSFLAAFDPGDRVAVVEPGYPCYRNDLMAFGVDVVTVQVGGATDYRPTVHALDAVGPLDGLVLASPNNPTGTMLGPDELGAIMQWATNAGVQVISDEIYHGITYDRPAPTALGIDDRALVINSFSKYFSMTGWRLGWLVAPDHLLDAIVKLSASLTISAPTLSQIAALAAFDAVDELDDNVAAYRRNRDLLLGGLPAAGFDKLAPADGAFYLWADVADLGIDASLLCSRWLDELSVAATPGIDFDRSGGDRSVRFSYAGAHDDISEALERLGSWNP